MASSELDRRTILGSLASGTGALGVSAAAGAASAQTATPTKPKSDQVIGIQIGSVSFWDEGTEKVLDILAEKACVNTLFIATFTYGNGIASRQLPGHPIPDHGPRKYDDKFHG